MKPLGQRFVVKMRSYKEHTALMQTNDAKTADSFHRAIRPILRTAQIFGVLPVSGLFAANVQGVHFRWRRLKVLLAVLVIAGATFETTLSVYRGLTVGMNMDSAASVIFLGSILLGLNLLFSMARNWPHLIRLWQRTEMVFLRRPYMAKGMTLKWHLRLVGFGVLFMALVEHILYITATVYKTHKRIEACNVQGDFFQILFESERAHIFSIFTFNHWWIVPMEYLNISMTFCWSFVDVFIMVISIGLATRFNQINDRLQPARGKIMPESYWIEMRCHYLIMTELLQHIDDRMSFMILLSCANNLFFICYLIFNSFIESTFLVNAVYFWLSLSFIIGRTLATLFVASSVHDASQKPLSLMRNVPSKAYTLEVQRFTDLIVHGVAALSGKRFFYLTRKLILAIAGTVATYELVLLDELDNIKPNGTHC